MTSQSTTQAADACHGSSGLLQTTRAVREDASPVSGHLLSCKGVSDLLWQGRGGR